jgi:hypothetical protein
MDGFLGATRIKSVSLAAQGARVGFCILSAFPRRVTEKNDRA